MLTTFYPPWSFGGDGIQVRRLARALADRGHEVTVVHSREGFAALSRRGAEAQLADDGCTVVPIDAGLGRLSPLATYLSGRPLATRRQLGAVLDGGFDVLHFHNPSLLGGPALLEMGTGLKLYTAHEQWLLCPSHVLWRHGRVCERPPCGRCELSNRRPPQLWRWTNLLQRSLRHVDALIAPSRTSAILHTRLSPPPPIEHLPHFAPVPPAGVEPERRERPYFLFVGRLESIKGVEILLAAFRARREQELLIAGAGSQETALRRAAADLPHVRFLGWVGAERLERLYRGALAVLVPTVGHESFGLVAVEGFARGTPAVLHRFGALAELAEDSGAALSYRSPSELDAALERLAADPVLRGELGDRGRDAYHDRWTPDVHLSGYLGLIERLAHERGGRELEAAAAASQ